MVPDDSRRSTSRNVTEDGDMCQVNLTVNWELRRLRKSESRWGS